MSGPPVAFLVSSNEEVGMLSKDADEPRHLAPPPATQLCSKSLGQFCWSYADFFIALLVDATWMDYLHQINSLSKLFLRTYVHPINSLVYLRAPTESTQEKIM